MNVFLQIAGAVVFAVILYGVFRLIKKSNR